jgi:hypothetical protein
MIKILEEERKPELSRFGPSYNALSPPRLHQPVFFIGARDLNWS